MSRELEPSDELLEKIPRFKELFLQYMVTAILEFSHISLEYDKDQEDADRKRKLVDELESSRSEAELKDYCSKHDLTWPDIWVDAAKADACKVYYRNSTRG